MEPKRDVEAAWRALPPASAGPDGLRDFLEEWGYDEPLLVSLLRRPVPLHLLQHLATARPWCDRPLLAGAVARHARTPPHLALRLLPAVLWRDAAQVAATPHLNGAVRQRAESVLVDGLPDMRLGDKIELARLATPPVLRALLRETDARILAAALVNPRLTQDALVTLLAGADATRVLTEQVAASHRWRENYAVAVELVLQPCTPLPLALARITSLVPADLQRVALSGAVAPLLRAAAERAAERA